MIQGGDEGRRCKLLDHVSHASRMWTSETVLRWRDHESSAVYEGTGVDGWLNLYFHDQDSEETAYSLSNIVDNNSIIVT